MRGCCDFWSVQLACAGWLVLCILDFASIRWPVDGYEEEDCEEVRFQSLWVGLAGPCIVAAITVFHLCLLRRTRLHDSIEPLEGYPRRACLVVVFLAHVTLVVCAVCWLLFHTFAEREPQIREGIVALACLVLVASVRAAVEVPKLIKSSRKKARDVAGVEEIQIEQGLDSNESAPLCPEIFRSKSWEARKCKSIEDFGRQKSDSQEIFRQVFILAASKASSIASVASTKDPGLARQTSATVEIAASRVESADGEAQALQLPVRTSRWRPLFEDQSFHGSLPKLVLQHGTSSNHTTPRDLWPLPGIVGSLSARSNQGSLKFHSWPPTAPPQFRADTSDDDQGFLSSDMDSGSSAMSDVSSAIVLPTGNPRIQITKPVGEPLKLPAQEPSESGFSDVSSL
eukprot:TRINITY_DN13726_c0_g1_i1.p1 TRINITY_DN13726_c0_g1~~TRINITY_DN13726_c0_g1_i1.p1  ORF type:complete len:399 (+),score=39.76 TRINITY_DN13726_c0_g1_i1:71-1267(+)